MALFAGALYHIENGLQPALAYFDIKFVVKRFKVDIHRVDVRKHSFKRFHIDVAIRDKDILQAILLCKFCGFENKFIPYERLIIRISDTEGTCRLRLIYDLLRSDLLRRRFDTLPAGLDVRIWAADSPQLDVWSERLVDGKALSEIFDLDQTH